ncbi:hypothetical protein BT96DRAFT_1031549 [Gymnopus androsaceus JB14]|uniref:Uncharacterized protein n=1 Tax=Gymnopus androsaceus JB14 TaxID=1447944 RepID=A0A6A4HN78_9AGAR|nr:hypothetical protein BT96DRAFT_1031549 [Gymnopus androsaceus JB14]
MYKAPPPRFRVEVAPRSIESICWQERLGAWRKASIIEVNCAFVSRTDEFTRWACEVSETAAQSMSQQEASSQFVSLPPWLSSTSKQTIGFTTVVLDKKRSPEGELESRRKCFFRKVLINGGKSEVSRSWRDSDFARWEVGSD